MNVLHLRQDPKPGISRSWQPPEVIQNVILVTICPSGCHDSPSFTSREGYALLCPGERVRTKLWAICPYDSPPQMRMTGNEGSTTCLSIARGSGLQNNTHTVSKLGVVDSVKDKKGTLALDCVARLSFWAVFRASYHF